MNTVTREWTHPFGVGGDVLRLLALVSAVAVLPSQPLEASLRFALIFALLLVTRAIQMPRPFDAVFALLLLVSAWCSALGWYFDYPWIDIPIHFILTGATAAMLYFGLARLDLLPKLDQPSLRRSVGGIVLIVTLLGGTASLLWEIYEWLAENFLPSRILVGYDDTVLDMTNGLLGSVVAGLCVAGWQRTGHGLRERE